MGRVPSSVTGTGGSSPTDFRSIPCSGCQRRTSPAFGTERDGDAQQSVRCQWASEPGAETFTLIWLPLACFVDEQDETQDDITLDILK